MMVVGMDCLVLDCLQFEFVVHLKPLRRTRRAKNQEEDEIWLKKNEQNDENKEDDQFE